MTHMLVRHRVADFSRWKSVYNEHAPFREATGLKALHLWRNEADPNEVIILFEVADAQQAKAFIGSTDAKQKKQAAGVVGMPDIVFLDEN
jgi:heme-degrading monooxygenase HmoA